MAGTVNRVILIGHVGQDPKIDTLTGGGKVATFSLATSDVWRDKGSGERRERTEWHRVVIFAEPLIEIVEKFVRKGSKLYVQGANQTRRWTGRDNVERFTTEVVLKAFRGELVLLDKADRAPAPGPEDYGGETGTRREEETPATEYDDEIPF